MGAEVQRGGGKSEQETLPSQSGSRGGTSPPPPTNNTCFSPASTPGVSMMVTSSKSRAEHWAPSSLQGGGGRGVSVTTVGVSMMVTSTSRRAEHWEPSSLQGGVGGRGGAFGILVLQHCQRSIAHGPNAFTSPTPPHTC